MVYFKNHLSSIFSTKNPKKCCCFCLCSFYYKLFKYLFVFVSWNCFFRTFACPYSRVKINFFLKEKDIFFSLVYKVQTPNLTCEARTLTLLLPSDHFSPFFLSVFNSGKQKLAHLNISIIFFWELYGGYDFIFLKQAIRPVFTKKRQTITFLKLLTFH